MRHPASISADRVARFVVLWVSGFYEVLEFCDVCGIRNLGYCYAVSATVCVIIADSQGEPFSGAVAGRCFLLIQIIRAIRQFINEVDTVDSAFEGRGCGTVNIDTANRRPIITEDLEFGPLQRGIATADLAKDDLALGLGDIHDNVLLEITGCSLPYLLEDFGIGGFARPLSPHRESARTGNLDLIYGGLILITIISGDRCCLLQVEGLRRDFGQEDFAFFQCDDVAVFILVGCGAIAGGRSRALKVVGTMLNLTCCSKENDYALFNMDDGTDFYFPLGNSDSLKLGDPVKLIGYPNHFKGDSWEYLETDLTKKLNCLDIRFMK